MKTLILLSLTAFTGCATSPSDASLIGTDLDAVRARLGPPIDCTYGGGTWTMAYRDDKGWTLEAAVTAIDDVVVSMAANLQPNGVNETNRWSGARIEEVIGALGEGHVESVSSVGASVRFGDLRLFVVDGRVLCPADDVTVSTLVATTR